MTSRSYVRAVVEELELWPPSRSVGEDIATAGSRASGRGGASNGSQVYTASMLTVLQLISLTVALAAGSARVTGRGASI